MRHVFAVFALLLMLPIGVAKARIGETLKECEARYGKGTLSQPDVYGFQKSGLIFVVHFHAGKADYIVFQKMEKDAMRTAAQLFVEEINTLLKANAGGRTWKENSEAYPDGSWRTTDGDLLARYTVGPHLLTIMTTAHIARAGSEAKAQTEERLKGF